MYILVTEIFTDHTRKMNKEAENKEADEVMEVCIFFQYLLH